MSVKLVRGYLSWVKCGGYNLKPAVEFDYIGGECGGECGECDEIAECGWSSCEEDGLQLGVRCPDSVGVMGVRGDIAGECDPCETEGGRECWKDHLRGSNSPSVDSVMVSV